MPRDEISSIAGKVLTRGRAVGITRAEMPEAMTGKFVAVENFNSLLDDARRLAGFVLEADPVKGPNRG